MAQDCGPQGAGMLDLPQGLLIHVLSWCEGADDADALLASCKDLHTLRGLPSAAALLLVSCSPYCAALLGTPDTDPVITDPAVFAAVLQLLQAGPESGGPFSASPQLLQGLLYCAAWNVDATLLRRLQAMPASLPSLSQAAPGLLTRAISQGSDLEVVELMLDLGADPLQDGGFGAPLAQAAAAAASLDIFSRLLQDYPKQPPPSAASGKAKWLGGRAMTAALEADNAAALALLLPLSRYSRDMLVVNAAAKGRPQVVQFLVQGGGLSEAHLNWALGSACRHNAVTCAEALLDGGALIDCPPEGPCLLLAAVGQCHVGLVELLLQRGAKATEEMLDCADTRLAYCQHSGTAASLPPALALAALLRCALAADHQG